VATQDQIFPMLVHKRIQVMSGYMPTENYYISINNYSDIIEKSTYVHNEKAKVYMAVSKKSPLAEKIKLLNNINNDLSREGFTSKIVKKYYNMYKFDK